MRRIFFLTYGIFSYVTLIVTVFFAICFIGNFGIANAMDAEPTTSFAAAFLIDTSLLILVVMQYNLVKSTAFQQKVLLRFPGSFKKCTQVVSMSLGVLLVIWRWQPLGFIVWSVDDSVMEAVLNISYLTGWSVTVISTLLAHHFDLLGLREAWCYYRGQKYTERPVLDPGHSQLIRHPFYIGFLLLAWSAPVMTITHLSLAVVITTYIIAALLHEKKGPIFKSRNHIQYED
jgi:protein-S-isoprenylcysteine O-methyltransferase Ste14